ncbi:hypothetical protein Tco_0816766 [Tanacetum coccineum]
MSFSKRPRKNTSQCYMKPLDSLKNWNNRFFWVDERVFTTAVVWWTSAPKDSMPLEGMYSMEDVAILNTRWTPIKKQPETLVCLIAKMDLFNLISAPNLAVIKTGTRPRTTHEVPLLTVIVSRNIDMDEPVATSESSGEPSTIERSPLDFSNETTADAPLVSKRRRKRANEESNANAPRKETSAGTMNSDPISFTKPSSVLEQDIAQSSKGATTVGGPELDPTSPTMVVSPGSIYQPEWGVTNGCCLDTSSSCQELVDHLAPPGYFSELRHLPNEDFLGQFNMTLAQKVAMEGEKKNLETLLEAEADMRKAAEAKNAELAQVTGEEKIKAAFEEFKKYEDKRVSARCAEMDSRLDALSIDFDEELYPHMLTAISSRQWVIGYGLHLAVLKCAESLELRQTFANVVSSEITKGFCDGLKYGVEQGEAKLDLAMVEGYDPEAEGKFIATMQALKDLKYPLIDELEKLKDAPIDVLMASLYLESDTRGDAPQWICSNHHASSDGIPISVPTAVPQGLTILLADAVTQTYVPEEESSPKLTRSKSLPLMYNLDWL